MSKTITIKNEVVEMLNKIRDENGFGLSYSQAITSLFHKIEKTEELRTIDRRLYFQALKKLEENGIKFEEME